MASPDIHLPQPSFWPLALALSVLIVAIGVLTSLIISLIGVILLIGSIVGWTFENQADDQEASHHE